MTYTEKAKQLGITVEQLREAQYEFIQCEGRDEKGNLYETIDAWVRRGDR